ncbi:MAG: M20 family metallo-hydrolase [Pseudomonadota bacterium]|nr:M20 family metallo-hydrolase [Pseudomonadota bacterium]
MRASDYVNSDRLWANLMELAEIGAIDGGGVNRQALTREEFDARELCIQWALKSNFQISQDKAGNIFFTLEGRDKSKAPIMTGSHLDSQPTGGKFDGAYGVVAGLEALSAISESGICVDRGIEVVAWMNEEGSRFAPGMMGSEAFVGARSIEQIEAVKDKNDISVAQELQKLHDQFSEINFVPLEREVFCFIETHIEQGPILENCSTPIGAVTGIQGVRRMRVKISGEEAHAGTTPYSLRKDAMAEASKTISNLYEVFSSDEEMRFTVGMFNPSPNVPSVVASEVLFSIDLRHPETQILASAEERVADILRNTIKTCKGEVWTIASADTISFNQDVIKVIEVTADNLGLPCRRIFSGAGHDARQMSYYCPSGMIFVPSKDGISHNIKEFTSKDDLVAGAKVLCDTLINLVNMSDFEIK